MKGLRHQFLRRLGASLAGLALYLQLAFASQGLPAVAATADPTGGFDAHALCLATGGGGDQPASPADPAPVAPTHNHAALCCLWHAFPGVQPAAAAAPQPVAYARLASVARHEAAPIPGRPQRPANARAPPTLT